VTVTSQAFGASELQLFSCSRTEIP